MVDDGTKGDFIAGDGVYSLAMSVPTAGTYDWKAVECGNGAMPIPLRIPG